MDKRKYRRPRVTIVSLKTKESVLQYCKGGRETNPIGPCNDIPGGDCENVHRVLSDKCYGKGGT